MKNKIETLICNPKFPFFNWISCMRKGKISIKNQPASDDIVMRQAAFCIYSLYFNKRHFFATFTNRYPFGKLRSSCSVMPRISISMTK